MMMGTVDIIEKGSEFDKAKVLLEAKFQQYNELFPIREGESVIMCFKPTKAVTWTTLWENFTNLTNANTSAREVGR